MRLASDDDCSTAPCRDSLPSRVACAALLHAHEEARTLGRPLLTAAGLSYLCQRLLGIRIGRSPARDDSSATKAAPAPDPLPSWDAEDRRLWLGERILKQFRQPAPHQTRLLDVFEEQGWVNAHIDDPLSLYDGESEEDAKRRLHETLKNLNRGIPAGTIRFRGDGTGQGVVWEYDRANVNDGSRLSW